MKQVRYGGSFSPPLSDDLLGKYKRLAESQDQELREAMNSLINCCEKWWNLPESTNGNRRKHASGTGVIQALDSDVSKMLWDHIPWGKELDAIQDMLEEVEKDASERNSKRVESWKQQVTAHIKTKHFKEPGVFEKVVKAAKSAGEWLGLLEPNESARVRAEMAKAKRCREEIMEALSEKAHDDIPYPQMEETPVRNACFHLLWHVRELDLDREPMTSDKL